MKILYLLLLPVPLTSTHLRHLPLICWFLSALLAMWQISWRKRVRNIIGSLSFIFFSFSSHWCLHILVVVALGFLHFCRITGAASPKQDPACTGLIPSHSLVPCYYLLNADVRCVTTGSSSKIFCLVSEETPHAYNREFRCAFLHTRVNRFCYLFIYFVFNPEMAPVHFWPALSLSSNCLFVKWKCMQHQWCIYLSIKYQQLQWFISPSIHSALEINNSEKKQMGLNSEKSLLCSGDRFLSKLRLPASSGAMQVFRPVAIIF